MSARKSKPASRRWIALIPASLLLAAGCGFRGPLYLPEDTAPGTEAQEPAEPEPKESTEDSADDDEEKRDQARAA